MLADVDQLILTCRSARARENIHDAALAYKATAYRSSIVSTWIAVSYDIVDKIYELAITGDKEAKIQQTKIENVQQMLDNGDPAGLPKALEFERGLLEIARDKFQLLSAQQHLDLTRLREDRNRCAHPTYQAGGAVFQPSAELARLHLVNAISHLLSQPPIQGKAARERIEKAILSSFFPEDHKEAVAALQYAGLTNPNAVLVHGLVDLLLFGFFEPNSPHHQRALSITALKALVDCQRSLAEARFKTQFEKCLQNASDADLGFLFPIIDQMPECHPSIAPAAAKRLSLYVDHQTGDFLALLISICLPVAPLKQSALSRIASMNADELKRLINLDVQEVAIVDRAVSLYTSVTDWHDANSVWSKVVQPLAAELPKSAIMKILDGTTQADLVGSHGFTQFMGIITSNHPNITMQELVAYSANKNWENYLPAEN